MSTLFSGHHVDCTTEVHQHGGSILGSVISARYFDDYLRFRKTQRLQTWEVFFLFISYNIKISSVYPLNSFKINFLLLDRACQEHLQGLFLLQHNVTPLLIIPLEMERMVTLSLLLFFINRPSGQFD